MQVCQHEAQKPKIVDQSLYRGEGQCLAYSAKHGGDIGQQLGRQMQMADGMSV